MAGDLEEFHAFEVVGLEALLVDGEGVVEIGIFVAGDEGKAILLLGDLGHLRMGEITAVIGHAFLALGRAEVVHAHETGGAGEHVGVSDADHGGNPSPT